MYQEAGGHYFYGYLYEKFMIFIKIGKRGGVPTGCIYHDNSENSDH